MALLTKTLVAALALAALPAASAHAQNLSPAMQEKAAENFFQADANQDGALSRDEFETLINLNADDSIGRAKMIRRFGRYDIAFGRLDANRDGFVTPEEIQAVASQARG